MAITPNVDFVSGAILTAAQQNNFPRGVVSFTTQTVTDSTVTAEEIQITSAAFTAVANRNYKITYYEPTLLGSAAGQFSMRIRSGTTLAGTVLNLGYATEQLVGQATGGQVIAITTFTAGSTQVVATLASSAGTASANRGAGNYAFILIEDIGTA